MDEIVFVNKMAMDRTMYGHFDPSSTYQPYRLTRKDCQAPGYALLADLQKTVEPNVSGKHVLSETFEYRTGEQAIYENTHRARGGNYSSELDTLLNDLDNVRRSKGSISGSVYGGGERLSAGRDILDSLQRTSATAASSATQELDDLMASLSDMKVASSPYTSTPGGDYALPVKSPVARSDPLDSMLGSLTADMHKQGIVTTQKGCCSACEKPIVGQVVTALGRTWHPEHFSCAHCQKELGTKNFFERDGQPYCEPDYHHLFSPRCSYCNGPILDKCVTAMERTWHPEHFFCSSCGQPFGDNGYHEKDGKPYCRTDYYELFAPKCGGCNCPISDNYISALNAQWHAECFVCRDCRLPFAGGSFYDHEGQPYCETHYHAKRGSLCAGCHKPITGRCITAMFRKYHPEHFVCTYCLGQLNKGTFKEQGFNFALHFRKKRFVI
ncbi:paxillin-like isoform X3 [Artemia franciscana]|uniref:paxillin-like isoform X3 n=1 Tax=Artemia franciscana TaxID=6661 RepID=UPI0032DB14C6